MSLHYLVLGHRDPPSIFRGMDSSSAGPSVWDLGRRDASGFGKHLQEMCHHMLPSKIKKKNIELWTGAFSCQSSIQRKPGEYSFQFTFNSIKRLGHLELGTSKKWFTWQFPQFPVGTPYVALKEWNFSWNPAAFAPPILEARPNRSLRSSRP